jgi:hypothetical protein
MQQVSIPCLLLPKDLLLRLKPVIKRTLADASFVVLERSCGDPFVERCRHGRCGRIGFRLTGGSGPRHLRCGRLLRFHGFPPMSSITNQIDDGKARPSVGRCPGQGTGCRERLLTLFPPLPQWQLSEALHARPVYQQAFSVSNILIRLLIFSDLTILHYRLGLYRVRIQYAVPLRYPVERLTRGCPTFIYPSRRRVC